MDGDGLSMVAMQQYLHYKRLFIYPCWCKMSVSYLQLGVFTLQYLPICGTGVFATVVFLHLFLAYLQYLCER